MRRALWDLAFRDSEGATMKINQFISRIKNGGMHLPVFQRGYIWPPTTAAKLMDSLYREYPVGVITTWETNNGQMIVDGQQRIGSIYACCTDEVPETYRDEEKQPRTGLHFNVGTEQFKFPTNRDLRDRRWVSVSQIMNNSADWRHQVRQSGVHDTDLEDEYAERVARVRNISNRDILMDDVSSDLTADEVVDIFFRLNTLGKTVKRGELDMARICITWPPAKVKAKEEDQRWHDTPLGRAMNEDAIIRTMTAVHTGGYPRDGLNAATSADLERAFNDAANANAVMAKSLMDRLAIHDKRAVPTVATLAPIARYLSQHGGQFPTAADEAKAIAYHLTATGWGVYHGSTETQIDSDVKCADEADPWLALYNSARSKVGEPKAEPVRFEINRRGGRFFSVVHVLQKLPNVHDWLTGRPIRDYQPDEIQQHHIFPRVHLQSRNTEPNDLEAIANIALLTGETNRKLGDRPPEDYLAEIDQDGGGMLNAHCIPRDRELWKIENYERFLEARRKLMTDAANRLMANLRSGRFN